MAHQKKKKIEKKYVAPSPHTKLNSTYVNNVNVKAGETIKAPEENTDDYLTIPGAEKPKGGIRQKPFNHINGKLKLISN